MSLGMKHVAVLLAVFNRREKSIRCLQQLNRQVGINSAIIDIFIVDGGSTDGTIEEVARCYPSVHIKTIDGVFWNRGMHAAWEWAVNHGKYDYYLWLNDDTFLYHNCVLSLLNTSATYCDNAIVVGATIDTLTKKKLTYGGRVSDDTIPPVGRITEIDHFNGNIVLIPSAVYNTLGNLDPYYTHSKGDFDYGIRARKAGIKMYQVAKPLGECDVHPRIDKWCDPMVPFRQRWKLMHKPNGMPPKESFHLNRKTSLTSAIKVWITIHIRCLFPSLWIKLGKAKIENN